MVRTLWLPPWREEGWAVQRGLFADGSTYRVCVCPLVCCLPAARCPPEEITGSPVRARRGACVDM